MLCKEIKTYIESFPAKWKNSKEYSKWREREVTGERTEKWGGIERERESSLWLRNSFTADENHITVILLKICLREQTATVSVKALISFIAKFETK